MGSARSYVPLSIESRSRVASWLWRATEHGWNRDELGFRILFTYERLRRLARWLP